MFPLWDFVILQILKNVLNIRDSVLAKVKDEILVLYCYSWEPHKCLNHESYQILLPQPHEVPTGAV